MNNHVHSALTSTERKNTEEKERVHIINKLNSTTATMAWKNIYMYVHNLSGFEK